MPSFFITHQDLPGHYHIWTIDRTIEEIWRYLDTTLDTEKYDVVLTLDIEDKAFMDYMASLYEDCIGEHFPGRFRRIDDISNPQQWVDGFPLWQQEKIRQQREWWLNQHKKETKGQIELF